MPVHIPPDDPLLTLSDTVVEQMHLAAHEALPVATGGLLFGHRDGGRITVTRAAVTADPYAAADRWHCSIEAREAVLEQVRDRGIRNRWADEGGRWASEVGIWASSPAVEQLGSDDADQILGLSQLHSGSVALLFYRLDGTIDCVIARRGQLVGRGAMPGRGHPLVLSAPAEPFWTSYEQQRRTLPAPAPFRWNEGSLQVDAELDSSPKVTTYDGICPRCNDLAQWQTHEGSDLDINCPTCG
jgi:hypothetical protein